MVSRLVGNAVMAWHQVMLSPMDGQWVWVVCYNHVGHAKGVTHGTVVISKLI